MPNQGKHIWRLVITFDLRNIKKDYFLIMGIFHDVHLTFIDNGVKKFLFFPIKNPKLLHG